MNLALILGVAVGVSAPAIKDSPKPAPAIVGEWVPDSLTMGGVTTTAPEGRSYEFTADGLWITRRDGVAVKSYPNTYTLDSKADPPTIDIGPLVRLGDGAPSQMLGIYKLKATR